MQQGNYLQASIDYITWLRCNLCIGYLLRHSRRLSSSSFLGLLIGLRVELHVPFLTFVDGFPAGSLVGLLVGMLIGFLVLFLVLFDGFRGGSLV